MADPLQQVTSALSVPFDRCDDAAVPASDSRMGIRQTLKLCADFVDPDRPPP